ncbi:MAG: NfeD family protein [Actinomycetota bacterium]|nr:NfeD family protein [Actinomycetota bacterium]
MRLPYSCRTLASSRRLLGALGCFVGASLLWSGAAGAQEDDEDLEPGGIDVVQVDGLLDPSNAALIRDVVRESEREGSSLVVLQLDASGSVDIDVDNLVDIVTEAEIPIGVWVGPSGADARGAAVLLALAAPVAAVAPGAGIGSAYPVELDDTSAWSTEEITDTLVELQERNGRSVDVADVIARRVSARDADRTGLTNGTQPTLGDFIVSFDGDTVTTAAGNVTLDVADIVGEGDQQRLAPNQVVRFHKLGLGQQVAHTLNASWVAYFLFVAGFSLIVFEFFTVGVGIAGAIGAIALAGACFGFSHLPVAPWALALLLFGIIGMAVDVQAGAIGAWTFIGGVMLIVGSVWLYDGSSRLDPTWWVIVLVCGLTILFMVAGMSSMVRSRFSTPTVGREDLVGEMGTAEVDVAPDGVVRIRDALWRAHTNRATPIGAGNAVRVVAVDGVMLEVEPEEGGARDYRDRARRG